MEIILTILLLIILLILSAFFSSSETGITGVSEGRMHTLAKAGNKNAQRILKLINKKDNLISALLAGNNLVNVLVSALVTAMFIEQFGEVGILYATISVTLILLIFAETIPKSYAIIYSDKVALLIALPLQFASTILYPITWIVQFLVKAITAPFGLNLQQQELQHEKEEQLRGFIDLHDGQDPDLEHERKMMHSILDLDNIKVETIMTHRKSVTMVNIDNNINDNIQLILQSPHTRIPLYKKQGQTHDIKGILHAKALLRALNKKSHNNKINQIKELLPLAAKPWFVPETATLLDQLQAFRKRKELFAIVVDEYGSFMGIVTLEDILEQIVGKIEDEHDISVEGVIRNNDNSYSVDAKITLRELNREFNWELPDDNAATLAGLILHEARIIPQEGQVFQFYGFRFKITKRNKQQISEIKITPPNIKA